MSRPKNNVFTMMVVGAMALMAIALFLIVFTGDIEAETETIALLLFLFIILMVLFMIFRMNRPKAVHTEYLMPLNDIDEEKEVQGKMPEDH